MNARNCKGLGLSTDKKFFEEQKEENLLCQSNDMSSSYINPLRFAQKHLKGDGYLGMACPMIMKPTQNTGFHMLLESSGEKKTCNFDGKGTNTGHGSIPDPGPRFRVSSIAGCKLLLGAESSGALCLHASATRERATSSYALSGILRASRSRGCSTRRGGLSLAFAEVTARTNMTSKNVSSEHVGLLVTTKEAVRAHEASSKSGICGTGAALLVSSNGISEENAGKLVLSCSCTKKPQQTATAHSVDRFTKGGQGMGERVKNVSNGTLTSSSLRSSMGVTKGRHGRAKTSGDLEVFMARYLSSDCTTQTSSLRSECGETEVNATQHCGLSNELIACTKCSCITGNQEMSLEKNEPRKAPPEFYEIRWNREYRQHSEVKFIRQPKGCKNITDNSIQQSAPMDAPKRNSEAGNERISYAYSMMEGVGRTLKGRDQVTVRNYVLRLTGFLET